MLSSYSPDGSKVDKNGREQVYDIVFKQKAVKKKEQEQRV